MGRTSEVFLRFVFGMCLRAIAKTKTLQKKLSVCVYVFLSSAKHLTESLNHDCEIFEYMNDESAILRITFVVFKYIVECKSSQVWDCSQISCAHTHTHTRMMRLEKVWFMFRLSEVSYEHSFCCYYRIHDNNLIYVSYLLVWWHLFSRNCARASIIFLA